MSYYAIGQNITVPNWLEELSASRFTLKNAEITIDNKDATYKDLLKISDTSLLKVEVYSRDYHLPNSVMQQTMKSSVDITLHKNHFPYLQKMIQ